MEFGGYLFSEGCKIVNVCCSGLKSVKKSIILVQKYGWPGYCSILSLARFLQKLFHLPRNNVGHFLTLKDCQTYFIRPISEPMCRSKKGSPWYMEFTYPFCSITFSAFMIPERSLEGEDIYYADSCPRLFHLSKILFFSSFF